ncbi:DUF2867 domain-containing protein [Leucothrix arctica]|uniref:DUF2867 domain-containing protein n=1 Tax=Leucothrix arctica TaxID=1481894 RepID=A0A317CB18_9GAMM|nr:DUF2867 domain-containing protein [Leucothrix arctica]PWQ95748.1 DUF2867 domain-containing protein [Leucothrix arctica]
MSEIPNNSKISSHVDGAYFADCHATVIPYENQSALDTFLQQAREMPGWINALMSLRNKAVSRLGLKNLGSFADVEQGKASADYKVGDRVGIFTLYENTHHEVILEDQDKHLGVRLSFFIEPEAGGTAKVHATTVVHVNNTLGKVYMFFVAPVHKVIVPATLKRLNA